MLAEDNAFQWFERKVNDLKGSLSELEAYAKQKLLEIIDVVVIFTVAFVAVPILTILFLIHAAKRLLSFALRHTNKKKFIARPRPSQNT